MSDEAPEHARSVVELCDASCGRALDLLLFWGHRPSRTGVTASCLSQWFEAPFTVSGLRYPTAEHFMMAEKARLFGDRDTEKRALDAVSPSDAKRLGRKVRGFDEQIWKRERWSIVVRANLAKFDQNVELRDFLIATSPKVLVEASPTDRDLGHRALA